jgi:hypothetical protein
LEGSDLSESNTLDRLVPSRVKLILVNKCPSLYELQLLYGKATSKKLTVNSYGCFVFCKVNVEVGLVVLLLSL